MRLIDLLFLAMPLWVGTRHALRFTPPVVVDDGVNDFLLMETGEFILLEISDKIILEP